MSFFYRICSTLRFLLIDDEAEHVKEALLISLFSLIEILLRTSLIKFLWPGYYQNIDLKKIKLWRHHLSLKIRRKDYFNKIQTKTFYKIVKVPR